MYIERARRGVGGERWRKVVESTIVIRSVWAAASPLAGGRGEAVLLRWPDLGRFGGHISALAGLLPS